MHVSVIGGSTVNEAEDVTTQTLGRRRADRGHEVICSGSTGVIDAVCRSTRSAGGHTIGIFCARSRRLPPPSLRR
nr:hypothetical protein [Halonotius pteroides]